MRNSLYPFGLEAGGQGEPAVASQIAGAFEGWSGQTVFRLRNGQLWQQNSPGYLYRYVYMPRVMIFSTVDGYRIRVAGVSRTIPVRRLR